MDPVIRGGVDFLVALGSTGEAATISPSESRLVLDAIINETKGRVPLVAGNFGSNNTRALVNQINGYSFDGIDAILSASPSYSKPSQQGIYEHYTVVADASPVPVILYNVPSRTSSNISADTTIRLSKHSNIIGIKEASGDLAQAKDIIRSSAEKFFVTSGDDVLAPAMTLSGGVGVISVLANAYPAEFSQMISHFVNGQSEQGKILEDKLYSFHDSMYSEGNPSGIKTVMEILGVCSADVRLPLTRVSSDLHRKLVELVKNL